MIVLLFVREQKVLLSESLVKDLLADSSTEFWISLEDWRSNWLCLLDFTDSFLAREYTLSRSLFYFSICDSLVLFTLRHLSLSVHCD